ncbi:MAG: hypothetical protein ACRC5H_08670 [Treponemataceae bacterium]
MIKIGCNIPLDFFAFFHNTGIMKDNALHYLELANHVKTDYKENT